MRIVHPSRRVVARCTGAVMTIVLGGTTAAQRSELFVNGTCGNDSWTGTEQVCEAPSGPKRTIQAAIDAAEDGSVVNVADGAYKGMGNRNLLIAKGIVLQSASVDPAKCIIDCEGAGFGIAVSGDTDVNDTTVDGFTITRGIRSNNGGAAIRLQSGATIQNCKFAHNVVAGSGSGGAVCCMEGVRANVLNCIIQNNTAEASGGGIFTRSPDMTIRGCIIEDNQGMTGGGGITCATYSAVNIIACTVRNNTAGPLSIDNRGGGILITLSTVRIVNCAIQKNCVTREGDSSAQGAGVAVYGVAPVDTSLGLTNCLITQNYAIDDGHGGVVNGCGVLNQGGTISIVNTTLANNSAPTGFGGGYCELNSSGSQSVRLENSIFWANEGDGGFEQIRLQDNDNDVQIRNCDIQGGLGGIARVAEPNVFVSNFAEEPLFADTNEEFPDYNLLYFSPCLNKGAASLLPLDAFDLDNDDDYAETIPFDMAGNLRQVNPSNCVDVGALENRIEGTCPPDLSGPDGVPDNDINAADLLDLLTRWSTVGGVADVYPAPCGDSTVNVQDLLEILQNWGTCSFQAVAPQTVDECYEKCLSTYPVTSAEFGICFDACVRSLCERRLIDCD
jgi:hypothetical protein